MDEPPPDIPSPLSFETADAWLDAFRAHPEWTETERDEHLAELIARVPGDQVVAAVRRRFRDLGGAEGEAILRIVEAQATLELLRELAEALVAQPDLPPERAWEAMALLEGEGLLDEYPALVERRDELEEVLDEEGSLEQLAEQLEGDPEGTWLALQGLGAVEAEIRPQIVEGLAREPLGAGLIEFFRLVGFAHDPAMRAPALDALERGPRDDPRLVAAWTSLADDHPDPEVIARARRWLGDTLPAVAATVAAPPAPVTRRIVRSLVTALDGQGRGSIILATDRGGARSTAAFRCDMEHGVTDVFGQVDPDPRDADALYRELAGQSELDIVEDAAELAVWLLGGSVRLCGTATPPALRYWLEEAVHPGFRPLPFPTPFPGWDPASLPFEEMPDRARRLLDACPDWIDRSSLTYEIAEEIALREGDAEPDPRRDAGAYRYLFEHRLVGRLELYRRMLFWMASFWQAAGEDDLGQSALALAWQLSDAEHAVPGHPFTVALATRSLAAAQRDLRDGIDPRRSPATPGT